MGYSHFLAMTCAIGAVAADTNHVKIPLKSVWALNIRGARNVRELDPPRQREPLTADEFIRTSLVEQIVRSLNHNHWPKEGERARNAFVVNGTGVDALRRAKSVMTGESQRVDAVPADTEITLVFFAYKSGRSVRVDEIRRSENLVTIKYHLHAHELMSTSPHFALIPLGKLQPGNVRVEIKRMPDTGPSSLLDPSRTIPVDRLTCGSFAFDVTLQGK